MMTSKSKKTQVAQQADMQKKPGRPRQSRLDKDSRVDHEVRKRLTEILASAGVSIDRVALEVLYLLPPEFLDNYVKLFFTAYKSGSISIGDENQVRKRTRDGQIPHIKGTGRKYREGWEVKDERAFNRKARVDKQLRKLIPAMYQDEPKKPRLRCRGCGQWCSRDWEYCAYCGEFLDK